MEKNGDVATKYSYLSSNSSLNTKLGIKLIQRHSTFFAGSICKVSNLNMHEFLMKTLEGNERKCGKSKVVYLQNYSYLC